MAVTHFDVVWIGTGQATLTVVPRILAAGKSVAVVEGGKFGGTCVNYGCTPTKTLVASAYALHLARRGGEFGFTASDVQVDFAEVMKPQQAQREESSQSIGDRLASLEGCTVLKDYGRFLDARTVEAGDRRLTGEVIVLHVGTRPAIPTIPGVDEVDWLTNETILDLRQLPQHLAIVGGGYVALEFAQIFRRLGSRVTVLQRGPRVMSREDPDVSEAITEILENEGVEIICDCDIQRVESAGGVTLAYRRGGGAAESLTASHLLLATGRIPNGDRVDAAAAGLTLDERGYVQVDDVTQTSASHIYAVGDVNGRGAFTHTSVNDGEIFWDHYSRRIGVNEEDPRWDRKISQRPTIYSMFTDPPLARVGMNEQQARDSGRRALMATMPMSRVARAREKRETNGFIKFLVDADTEQILGATILGTSGDEVIAAVAAFMQTGASYKLYRRAVFPHPTVSELTPWCLDGLQPLD